MKGNIKQNLPEEILLWSGKNGIKCLFVYCWKCSCFKCYLFILSDWLPAQNFPVSVYTPHVALPMNVHFNSKYINCWTLGLMTQLWLEQWWVPTEQFVCNHSWWLRVMCVLR